VELKINTNKYWILTGQKKFTLNCVFVKWFETYRMISLYKNCHF